ncbi:DUF4123 domain-containing protein [Burkholderia contaminans]|uniref:DUF4123 domain-containing protein n=1 Tax=Burkholderia contaminans TaxID=488447 RepID=UPI001CF44919|nr:DUF4123 domain-containing protein [Burkholderia contaminans]MCA7914350.1 DUF4123 domain-containing protein [Burkholderia contaminans]UUX41553.1 DUF4123 domain-containing protein [Burkholderia contaminans]
MSIEVIFTSWKERASLPLCLFALADGLLYAESSGSAPVRSPDSAIALLDGTPDASLADAGPWLFDFERSDRSTRGALEHLAQGEYGISWIISAYHPVQLASELRERLDGTLPDGRSVMLRYYDARVMRHFAPALTSTERTMFFFPTFDWLIEIDGQLFRAHPHAA